MAWEKIDITIDGETIKGDIDGNMIEMPFMDSFSDNSVVSIGESK